MITAEQVWQAMGLDGAAQSDDDTAHMAVCVDAVNAMLPRIVPRVRQAEAAEPAAEWPGDCVWGGVTLGSRLFARRNSPTGVASFSDAGAAYVAKNDPDLERTFGIGAWAPPMLG